MSDTYICHYCNNKLKRNITFSEYACNNCQNTVRYVINKSSTLEAIIIDDLKGIFSVIIDFVEDETRIYDNERDYFKPLIVLDCIADITPLNFEKKIHSILTFM